MVEVKAYEEADLYAAGVIERNTNIPFSTPVGNLSGS
jgi:hypothetical protein